jgi:hypothetical protein
MGSAKIAAGDVLKFLSKQTYPEKCPLAAGFTNKFLLLNDCNFATPEIVSHYKNLKAIYSQRIP